MVGLSLCDETQPTQHILSHWSLRGCIELLTIGAQRFLAVRGIRDLLWSFMDLATSENRNAGAELEMLIERTLDSGVNILARDLTLMRSSIRQRNG